MAEPSPGREGKTKCVGKKFTNHNTGSGGGPKRALQPQRRIEKKLPTGGADKSGFNPKLGEPVPDLDLEEPKENRKFRKTN